MSALPESVSVVGAGSWGTALALVLADNISSVRLWGRSSAAIEDATEDMAQEDMTQKDMAQKDIAQKDMARQRCNRRYLPGVSFPANLTIETDFDALADDDLCFVVAVPSHAFRERIEALHRNITAGGRAADTATLIWGTKGFDPGSGKLLSEVVDETFGSGGTRAVISGPSFARETAQRLPTALTLACAERGVAESLANWFRNPTTRVYFSSDLIGVQLGGAIKNVMAIAAGISDGLGFGANARAALITRGLAELTRLGVARGGCADTFTGLAGVGDLILTCTDDQSRNRRFGLGIGAGKPREQICREIGQEIEGIHTVRELYSMSRELNVEMPITEQVYRVVHQGHDPQSAVRDLLGRDPRAEHGHAS